MVREQEEKISFLINRIVEKLINDDNTDDVDISVLSGEMGKLLFLSYTGGKHYKFIIESIEKLFKYIQSTPVDLSYVEGLAGFGWGINFLCRNNKINIDENECLSDLDDILFEKAVQEIRHNNFDLFYGGIGYCTYFLERYKSNPDIKNKLELLIYELSLISIKTNDGVYFQSEVNLKEDVIDLSISHGISSIVIFLSKAVECGISTKLASSMIKQMCYFIESKTRNDGGNKIVPDIIEKGIPKYSPMRWCHGQLSIAYALAKASSILNEEKLRTLAQNLIDTYKYKDYDNHDELTSAMFCHGTLGVAYIFKRTSQLLNDNDLMSRYNYWIDQSLGLLEHQIELNHFKSNRKRAGGILTGFEGIGLFLIDIETTNNDWQESLLF